MCVCKNVLLFYIADKNVLYIPHNLFEHAALDCEHNGLTSESVFNVDDCSCRVMFTAGVM